MTERLVLRGFLANVDVVPPLIMTFQFNPVTVSDNKAVSYADRSTELCGNAPAKVYVGGGPRTVSFALKLDGLEQGADRTNPLPLGNGISTELAKLRSFLYPKADAWATFSGAEGKRLASPPRCVFGFGQKVLECVVTEIRIEETLYNSMLAPVRADATVTLSVVEDDDNVLYQIDTQLRNTEAALGLQNARVF